MWFCNIPGECRARAGHSRGWLFLAAVAGACRSLVLPRHDHPVPREVGAAFDDQARVRPPSEVSWCKLLLGHCLPGVGQEEMERILALRGTKPVKVDPSSVMKESGTMELARTLFDESDAADIEKDVKKHLQEIARERAPLARPRREAVGQALRHRARAQARRRPSLLSPRKRQPRARVPPRLRVAKPAVRSWQRRRR